MHRKATVILETPRLVLRHFAHTDKVCLSLVLGDPEVMKFSLGVKSPSQIKAWLIERLEDYQHEPDVGLFAVVQKESEKFIGYCGFIEYENLDEAAETEISYRLIRSEWGNGYATEAAAGVRDYGFQMLNRERFIAIIDPANLRSVSVAQKIGMGFEKEIMLEGYTHPDHVYAIERKSVA